jgi:putative ABC transport system permease protein
MLENFVLHFFRNLLRQKLFAIVNLLGLTAGIASTLVIYLYVRSDFSHDLFHENARRIYRVNQSNTWNASDERQVARTGPGVGQALSAELPEIESVARIHTAGNLVVTNTKPSGETVSYDEENVLAADSNFFTVFSFRLLKGNAKTCLKQPHTVILTETYARKYFGNVVPIGKLLQVGTGKDARTFEVTAVVKDIPYDSYINFGILMSMASFPKASGPSWLWTQLETFVLLDKNADVEEVRGKLQAIPRQYAESSLQSAMNISFDDYLKTGKSWNLYLQPLTEIHLHSDNVIGNSNIVRDIKIVYTLVGAAAFIILLSCVNFINLSTAQFTKRIKDASIRKVLGQTSAQLKIAYILEGFAFCLIAVIIAVALVQLCAPWLSAVIGMPVELDIVNDSELLTRLIMLLLLMSVLSGTVPALLLSAFNPVDAIKGKIGSGREGKRFRNGMVVLQFAVSIVLIICTTIVFQQLRFFSEKDLGFDKNNLMVVDHLERVDNGESLTKDLANLPGVESVSYCAAIPLKMASDIFRPRNYGDKDFVLEFAAADENYLATMGIQILTGRNFSGNAADVDKVLLNESAVKALGWDMDESVVGKVIDYPNEDTQFQVVGIINDYHFNSLEERISPMALFHIKSKVFSDRKFALLRFASGESAEWEAAIAAVGKTWKRHAGDLPFQYEFVDDNFAARLQTQQQFAIVLQAMSGLAILIAFLGLLGMVVFSLERRTKEIGIRKISGATTLNIMGLISAEYAKLIIAAFAIGAPASYWLSQKWLRDFGNRITPSLWVFFVTGICTLVFAFTITAYHSLRAARQKAVDVLRDE